MSAEWWLGVIVGLAMAAVLIYVVAVLASAYATRRGAQHQAQNTRRIVELEPRPSRDEDYLQALQVQRRKAQREYARLLGDGFLALAERQLACIYKLDEEIRKHS